MDMLLNALLIHLFWRENQKIWVKDWLIDFVWICVSFRGEDEATSSSGKDPLLYSNFPSNNNNNNNPSNAYVPMHATSPTPNPNSYVPMNAGDHYRVPSTSAHEYVPFTDDKDGGTYVWPTAPQQHYQPPSATPTKPTPKAPTPTNKSTSTPPYHHSHYYYH